MLINEFEVSIFSIGCLLITAYNRAACNWLFLIGSKTLTIMQLALTIQSKRDILFYFFYFNQSKAEPKLMVTLLYLVFPRLAPVECFPALGAACIFPALGAGCVILLWVLIGYWIICECRKWPEVIRNHSKLTGQAWFSTGTGLESVLELSGYWTVYWS